MGFGHARGATLQPLNAVAHMFAGSRAFMTTGFQPAITGGALVLHFLSTIIWGVLLAYIAAPLTGWARAIAPVSVGIVAYLVDRFVAPNGLRPGFEQLLSEWRNDLHLRRFGRRTGGRAVGIDPLVSRD